MKLLLLAWVLFVASAAFWLPAYKGSADAGGVVAAFVVIPCAVAAVLAGLGLRDHARSKRDALLSTVPALALLGAAALAGYLVNRQRAEFRGEPLYLYLGVTLWASWAALMLVAALAFGARWSRPGGVVAGFLVAVLGFFAFGARFD